MERILIHQLFFEQIMDKPGIRLFLDDTNSEIQVYLIENQNITVNLECNHAIDEDGTQYFFHQLRHYDDKGLPGVMVTSATKEELNKIRKAMDFRNENREFHISYDANNLASDGVPDIIRFNVYEDRLGLEIVDYRDYGEESSDSLSSITISEDGKLIEIDNPSYDFYFHNARVEQMFEDNDDIDIKRFKLKGKAKAFYEKITLEHIVDEELESVMSL